MMYALVHYPAVDLERINQIRNKYDPQFHLIAPHITIMFPTPDSIGERSLVSQYWDEVRPFIPHMTLGAFSEKSEEYALALKEAERLNLDYESMLDRLDLIKVNDERSQIVWSKEFLFK